jgi:hypothetical protein
MRSFLTSVATLIALGVGSYLLLENVIQQPADQAFSSQSGGDGLVFSEQTLAERLVLIVALQAGSIKDVRKFPHHLCIVNRFSARIAQTE